ncbi:acyltransferase family protein [Okibacterium endophyticum]
MTKPLTSPAVEPAPSTSGGGSLPAARRFSGLDGLRAIAVALVIVYHLFPGTLPGGFLGVDVFFVISGFLITGLLVRDADREGRVSLRRFWQRRARRLLPALVVLVIVCTTAALLIGKDLLVGIGLQVLGAATFSYNWLQVAAGSSYFDSDTPELFRNLWSLAVEEQFYIVWPFLLIAVLAVRRRWMRPVILVLAAVASALWMNHLAVVGASPTRLYYGTDTHAFGLLLGAALAFAVSMRRTPADTAGNRIAPWAASAVGALALIGVIAGSWLLHDDEALTFNGGLALVTLLTAIVIWASVRPGSALGSALDNPPMRYIGERSYGLYLWHWPVLVLVTALMPTQGIPTATDVVVTGIIAAIVTVIMALLSYRYVEQPVRRTGFRGTFQAWRSHLVSRRWRSATTAAATVIALGLASATVMAVVVAPSQSSAQDAVQRGSEAISAKTPAPARQSPTPAETSSATPSPVPTMPSGDQITAVGDSVMLAAAPELQALFPGIQIDATVSRSMYAAPSVLRALADAGQLRQTVLIGLGTNGPVQQSSIDEIFQVTGPDRAVVFINAYAPRDWIDGANQALVDAVPAHKNAVIADWHNAVSPYAGELLAGDKIHPGPRGGRLYAETINDALQELIRSQRSSR